MPSPSAATLLITADPTVVDDVLRLAAAAGAQVQVEPDARRARSCWADAPLVLVGRDAAPRVALSGLARRDDVALLSYDADDAAVWALAVDIGASKVVELPDGERWLVDALGDAADGTRDRARLLAVAGGRGGAGASVLAATVASAAAAVGHPTTLVDADPLGGGIDLLFGGEEVRGLRWRELARARGRVGATSLRNALPSFGGLAVLSWDRDGARAAAPEAMRAVLGAARRGAELVVVDVSRHLDPAAQVAVDEADVALLVVPAEVRAAAAAALVAERLCGSCRDVRVVVRAPGPARLEPRAVADALGLPLAGVVHREPAVAAAIERGEPPSRARGSLAGFAERFVRELLAPPAAAA